MNRSGIPILQYMSLSNRVYHTIRGHRMISPGDSILVGVSGGPDSVALLHTLDELKHRLGCTLAVAHFDHGIRGQDSRQDAAFVRKLAEMLELPFQLGQDFMPGRSAGSCGKGGNLEARAREARYRFLESTAARLGTTKVAVGHTQDDQAETMLMWMLRGCGPSGLGGMPPIRPLAADASGRGTPVLIRPLIDVPRADVMRYLDARGLEYREDKTNADTRYLRNWIRSDLLPALVERTDNRLKARLARLSAQLQGDESLLDRYVLDASADAIRDGDLSCAAFRALGAELRPRVLRTWLRSILGDLRGVGFHHVDSVMRLAAAEGPSGQVSLPRGWKAVRDYGFLRLMRELETGRAVPYVYELPLEGEVRIDETGVTITAFCSSREDALNPKTAGHAIFDRDAVRGAREVRNRRPGDRFQPLGMTGHKKIKDLFIEKKTPRSLRDRLPLILVDGEVLWVPGLGRSDAAKVDASTREVWNLEMSAIDLGITGSY